MGRRRERGRKMELTRVLKDQGLTLGFLRMVGVPAGYESMYYKYHVKTISCILSADSPNLFGLFAQWSRWGVYSSGFPRQEEERSHSTQQTHNTLDCCPHALALAASRFPAKLKAWWNMCKHMDPNTITERFGFGNQFGLHELSALERY